MKALPALKTKLNQAGATASEDGLINVDYKVILVCLATLALFLLFLGFNLHASSIPFWNNIIPYEQGHEEGFMIGDPKGVRGDEWIVMSPFIFSQSQLGFPVSNKSVGAYNDPLLMSLPVRHFSTVFRPQNWGYFVFGLERGFSYHWAFKIFGLGLSFFLLLMLVTNNHFGLSLLGSFWLFFTSFTQWWFSTTMPELIISFNLVFLALAYLFLTKKKLTIIVSLIFLVVFGINFVLIVYPPFQIPLLYLLLFLLPGLFLEKSRRELFKKQFKKRLLFLGGSGALGLAALYLFYLDAKSTIDAVSATVYPGRRIDLGGEITLQRLFSGFSLEPLNAGAYPAIWSNASETSNFILLFPAVLLAATRNFVLRIKNSPLIVSLSAYIFVMIAWALVRFPAPLAKLTLLGFAPGKRVIIGIGIASIIISIVYLSQPNQESKDRRFVWSASLLIFAGLLLYAFLLKTVAGDLLRYRHVLLMATAFAVIFYLFLSKRKMLFALAIFLVLIPSYLVNPLSSGLDPIYKKDVAKAAAQLRTDSPDSEWLVYSDRDTLAELPEFLKASGLNVFNGVKYTPDLRLMEVLDPEHKFKNVYNRYAHIGFWEPESGNEKVIEIVLAAGDTYIVIADPCSGELKRMGIERFAFTYKPDEKKLSCLSFTHGFESSDIWFYKRKG